MMLSSVLLEALVLFLLGCIHLYGCSRAITRCLGGSYLSGLLACLFFAFAAEDLLDHPMVTVIRCTLLTTNLIATPFLLQNMLSRRSTAELQREIVDLKKQLYLQGHVCSAGDKERNVPPPVLQDQLQQLRQLGDKLHDDNSSPAS